MILQRHPALNEEIREYGCGFMAALFHAVRFGKAVIDSIEDVESLYREAVRSSAMRRNCFIDDWDGLFTVFGLDARYTGRHESPTRECRDDEIEILRFPGHFVCGDGYGNVTYDPWGLSTAVTKELQNKRIFKV